MMISERYDFGLDRVGWVVVGGGAGVWGVGDVLVFKSTCTHRVMFYTFSYIESIRLVG